MRLLLLVELLLLPAIVAAQAPKPNDGASWPTLHGDLTRSGYYPAFPKGPLKLSWRKELHTELTGPRCEVIAGGGQAFMGTYAGNLYAFDVPTGREKWVFKAGGPIGHSPALVDGTLYVGSMDRKLYALNAADGKLKWTFEAAEGIWTSPTVHRGLVMFGARDGVFHALSAADGKLAWTVQTQAPILQTASITADGTRVLFGSEDMHVYCAEVASGKLLWRSSKLAGLSLRDHFPVIVDGLALVTTNSVKDFHTILDEHQNMYLKWAGAEKYKDKRYIPAMPEAIRDEQDRMVEFLKARPEEQTFYALRIKDGTEPWIAPLLYQGGLHNPMTPPCVNLKTGDAFVYVRTAYGVWDGGGEVRPYSGIGDLDLKTGRVELIEHSHKSKDPARPAGRADMPWMTFNTIGDETQTLACSDSLLFSIHQGFIGSMNLKTGITANLYGKRDTYGGFYGAGNFGWENQGGREKAKAAGQPYGLVNEWHGPAKAIISVAGKYVFFPVGSQVICLEGNE